LISTNLAREHYSLMDEASVASTVPPIPQRDAIRGRLPLTSRSLACRPRPFLSEGAGGSRLLTGPAQLPRS
jgi:hypothetical protein